MPPPLPVAKLPPKYPQEYEANRVVITGLPGCGKSTEAISYYLKSIKPKSTSFIIVATPTYELAKEKADKLKRDGVACVVISSARSEDDDRPHRYADTTDWHITIGIQLVFTSHQLIFRMNWLEKVKSKNPHRYFERLIVDEASVDRLLVPVPTLTIGYKSDKYRKVMRDHLAREYSDVDANAAMELASVVTHPRILASWAAPAEYKISILTAEILPALTLMAFSYVELKMDKNADLEEFKSTQTIRFLSHNVITRELIDMMARHQCFGPGIYSYMIANALNPEIRISLEAGGMVVHNYTTMRGKNDAIPHAGSVLVVMRQADGELLENIVESLAALGIHGGNKNAIKKSYYKDELYQAVGRVLWYRSRNTKINEVDLIIHDSIFQLFKDDEHPFQWVEEPKDYGDVLADCFASIKAHEQSTITILKDETALLQALFDGSDAAAFMTATEMKSHCDGKFSGSKIAKIMNLAPPIMKRIGKNPPCRVYMGIKRRTKAKS